MDGTIAAPQRLTDTCANGDTAGVVVTSRYLAELREIDGNYIRTNRDADPYATAYCPLCRCNKSGDAEQPNSVCEPCENSGCACHAAIDSADLERDDRERADEDYAATRRYYGS